MNLGRKSSRTGNVLEICKMSWKFPKCPGKTSTLVSWDFFEGNGKRCSKMLRIYLGATRNPKASGAKGPEPSGFWDYVPVLRPSHQRPLITIYSVLLVELFNMIQCFSQEKYGVGHLSFSSYSQSDIFKDGQDKCPAAVGNSRTFPDSSRTYILYVKCYASRQKTDLIRKYLRYCHKSDTIVLSIPGAIL